MEAGPVSPPRTFALAAGGRVNVERRSRPSFQDLMHAAVNNVADIFGLHVAGARFFSIYTYRGTSISIAFSDVQASLINAAERADQLRRRLPVRPRIAFIAIVH